MIGIIGGSGLYAMGELGTPRAHTVTTPFGAPSSPLMTGTLRGREVAFLARHGLQHQLLPGEINFRANIWALKSLGVRTVIGGGRWGACAKRSAPAISRCRRSTWTSPGERVPRASSAAGWARLSRARIPPAAPPPR